jgi:hypothetical protein
MRRFGGHVAVVSVLGGKFRPGTPGPFLWRSRHRGGRPICIGRPASLLSTARLTPRPTGGETSPRPRDVRAAHGAVDTPDRDAILLVAWWKRLGRHTVEPMPQLRGLTRYGVSQRRTADGQGGFVPVSRSGE